MVYVDDAVFKRRGGRKAYAHLVATTLDELHEFCASVGIPRHAFHSNTRMPHYDVTEIQREQCIARGAIAVSSREIIRIIRKK